MQNDPKDIEKLYDKLGNEFSMVSGRRANRQVSLLRIILSKTANHLIRFITGVKLLDHGCGLKIFRKDDLASLKYNKNMHRFIGLWLSAAGHNVTEIEVVDRPRIDGVSKFGMERLFNVPVDVGKFIFTNPAYSTNFFITLFVVFGLILRVWSLDRDCFWLDEVLSVRYAKLPIYETIGELSKFSVHPPLYFWTLHFWIYLFGTSELAVRSLSVLYSILTIPVVFLVGKELWNWRVGLIGALLFTINPYQIRYAQEGRAYSMMVLFGLVSLLLLYRYANSTKNWKDKNILCLSVLSTTCLVSLHIYGILIWLSLQISAVLLLPRKKYFKWVFCSIPVIIVLLSLEPMFLEQISHSAYYQWLPNVGLANLIEIFTLNSGGIELSICYVSLIFVLIFTYLDIHKYNLAQPSLLYKNVFILLFWTIAVPIMALAISQFRPVFYHRYFIVSGGGVILLASCGLDVLFNRQKQITSCVLILIIIFSLIGVGNLYHQKKQDWPAAISWIIKHGYKPEDGIIMHANWNKDTLLYYFPNKTNLNIINLSPEPYYDRVQSISPTISRSFDVNLKGEEFSKETIHEAEPYSRLWIIVSFSSYTPEQIVEALKPKFHVVDKVEFYATNSEGNYDPLTTILMERN